MIFFCKLFLLPLSFLLIPISLVLWLLGYRFLGILHIQSIGHLAVELDCYLKDLSLKGKKKPKAILLAPTRKTFFGYPKYTTGSSYLAELWKQQFIVVTSPYLTLFCRILRIAARFLVIDLKKYAEDYTRCKAFDINYSYKGPPMVKAPEADKKEARALLESLGVPQDKKIVVFANRDSNYRGCKAVFSNRNNDINRYWPALQEIVRRGYYCVRIGSPNSQELDRSIFPEIEPYIIDFSKSRFRSDKMDILFIEMAHFFLTGSSGITAIPLLFQIPMIIAAQTPLCHFAGGRRDINIPKLYKQKKTGKVLTFSEILKSPAKYYILDEEYEKNNLTLIEPTEEDILLATKEMLYSLEKKDFSKSSLQKQFDSFSEIDAYGYPPASRISEAFLKKHSKLLIEKELV